MWCDGAVTAMNYHFLGPGAKTSFKKIGMKQNNCKEVHSEKYTLFNTVTWYEGIAS